MMRARSSPWTIAGWAFSTVYCVEALARLTVHTPQVPANGEFVLLALMTVAFVVAGVRREPQATPWWWPTGPSLR